MFLETMRIFANLKRMLSNISNVKYLRFDFVKIDLLCKSIDWFLYDDNFGV